MKAENESNTPEEGRVLDSAREEERVRDNRDITRFLEGDMGGFNALVERYRHQAYGIALGLTGSHDDAMDAAQKAFIRIMKALPRFREGEPFFPWFYRIVRNAALNQRRDEKRHKGEIPLEWVKKGDGRPSPLDETIADEVRQRLWQGIENLPQEQREVFLLYNYQGRKYREIADALGIPIGTVMSRLYAARMQLRRAIGEETT